ncbi:MFS transporter [Chromobacterium vaccinii]|uniref:MFS transporter n=1 Tax=Chromobacterium vaccinii TaxID=1108595 RepID=UPI003C790215
MILGATHYASKFMIVTGPVEKIRKEIWVLLFGAAAIKAANFMTIPFIAVFLIKNSQLNSLQVGMIVALSPLASLLGGFFGGQLSDIIGRKVMLFSSLFMLSLIFFGFYLAAGQANIGMKLMLFSLLNAGCGLFSSLFHPVSAALMGDLSPARLKGKIYQLRYFSINVGAALGPVIGGWLGANASRTNFLHTSYFYLCYALILTAIFIRKSRMESATAVKRSSFKASCRVLAGDRRLQYLILSGLLFNLCYSQLESTISQVLVSQFADGVKYFSYMLTANGLTVIVFHAPVYAIGRRVGLNMSLLAGSVIFALGMMLMTLQTWSVFFLFAAIFLISIGEAFVFPVATELIERLAPDSLRGSYFGASTFRNLGLAIGPVVGGYVLTHYGPIPLFVFISMTAIASAIVALYGEQLAASTTIQQSI